MKMSPLDIFILSEMALKHPNGKHPTTERAAKLCRVTFRFGPPYQDGVP